MAVYFIKMKRSGRIKIGYSKNVLQRAMGVRAERRSNVVILATMEGDRVAEKSLHLWFDWLKIEGEFFEPHPELLDYIEKNATQWTGPLSIGWERPEEYWQRIEKPSPKVGDFDRPAGPRIKRNLYRLAHEGRIPRTQRMIAALVEKATGQPFRRTRLSLMLASVSIESRYIEQLAAGLGLAPADLLR